MSGAPWGGPGAPGPVALVGSGEYLPAMHEVEARLLDGRAPRYVQLATAAAPEGQRSLARWHELGRRAAERLGVEQVVVPVVDRVSADDPGLAALVEGAGLVYLSGGNPKFLAETLRGTAVWAAIEREWRAGAALAGCSAGAMALCGSVPDVRHPLSGHVEGLGVLPGLAVVPHFDRFGARLLGSVVGHQRDPGAVVVGIDEDTALVGGPSRWDVVGRAAAWLLLDHGRQEHLVGTSVEVHGLRA
ncbi:Type 1 glutamine amidotransferase-like domain-containing protein [Aquipuribacter nitratireducens]|uniref:Type 1 glutamine amidotransferase-like domain-containing protein n=1 Tax=Aquipuribacter nitratireducens TaxID=650104 RepID=A0ABW0GPV8_9MICO